MRSNTAVLASAFCLNLVLATPAYSAVVYKISSQNPAAACALTKSVANGSVSIQANGFRNQGAASVFVICGYNNVSRAEESDYVGLFGSRYAGFVKLEIDFSAFDGNPHVFNCTGASRYSLDSPLRYLTKQVTVNEGGGAIVFDVQDAASGAYSLDSKNQSITCVLPPGVAIVAVNGEYGDVDGISMACYNDKDDDGDGLFNENDPGCGGINGYEPSDNNEEDDPRGAKACSDSWDNDGDGRMDYPADPQCSSFDDDSEMYF